MALGVRLRAAGVRRSALPLAAVLVACCQAVVPAQPAIDEMQQAVIDSLASSPRETPPQPRSAAETCSQGKTPDACR